MSKQKNFTGFKPKDKARIAGVDFPITESLELVDELTDRAHKVFQNFSFVLGRVFLLHYDTKLLSKYEVDALMMLQYFIKERCDYSDALKKSKNNTVFEPIQYWDAIEEMSGEILGALSMIVSHQLEYDGLILPDEMADINLLIKITRERCETWELVKQIPLLNVAHLLTIYTNNYQTLTTKMRHAVNK